MIPLSLEIFPPKTDAGLDRLANAVDQLTDATAPRYVSVTYGAGGSNKDRSFDAIEVARRTSNGAPIAAHLTCVGQTRTEIDQIIDRYAELGVDHIVALRGDPPAGIDAPYEPHPDGYQTTAELVAAIKRRGDFYVSVSAYPETHPQSPTIEHDLDVLAAKVEAGADAAMTQMFFDNDLYAAYCERVERRGISIPIVPGVFPIHSLPKVASFAARCGATLPDETTRRFDGLDADSAAAFAVAVEVAAGQIIDLERRGAPHVHLYTLNKSPLVTAVARALDQLTTST